MKRVIYRTATGINFIGVAENDGASVNDWRVIVSHMAEAINVLNRRLQHPKPHKGKSIPFTESFEDTDDKGRFKQWAFPVFVTDRDEFHIYVKIYLRGGEHSGSCVIWANKPYSFYDIPSASQFEVQGNTAVNFATKQVKAETNK